MSSDFFFLPFFFFFLVALVGQLQLAAFVIKPIIYFSALAGFEGAEYLLRKAKWKNLVRAL